MTYKIYNNNKKNIFVFNKNPIYFKNNPKNNSMEIDMMRNILAKISKLYKLIVVDGGCHKGIWLNDILNTIEPLHVYAYEPNLPSFNYLIETYKYDNVDFINKGLDKENYITKVAETRKTKSAGWSLLDPLHTSGTANRLLKVVSLDSELLHILDNEHYLFIKLDIEGYEFRAINGCKELLTNNKILSIQFEYKRYHIFRIYDDNGQPIKKTIKNKKGLLKIIKYLESYNFTSYLMGTNCLLRISGNKFWNSDYEKHVKTKNIVAFRNDINIESFLT